MRQPRRRKVHFAARAQSGNSITLRGKAPRWYKVECWTEDRAMPLTTDEKLLALSRETIEVFDKVNSGVHPGFRPAHAKGILLRGVFTPSSEGASLTRAPHLQRNSTPVTVRFSNLAGIPTVADNDPQGAGPRAFAVRFHLGEHVHTDIIGHTVDAFPVRTAEGLVQFLNALIATDPTG